MSLPTVVREISLTTVGRLIIYHQLRETENIEMTYIPAL